MAMTSDEDIIHWVEENYDPYEMGPEEFIATTSFRGARYNVALRAAREIAEEAGVVPPPPEIPAPPPKPPSFFQRVVGFLRRLFGL